ncbi:MAG: DNA polymerase III subunit delta [Candidatus Paceibacterales bacterium]
MIIFLYGQDTYRSRRKLKEIIEHYKKAHQSGLNLKYFDGQKLNFRDFKDEMRQTSMFKEKKLVVLTDIFSNPEFKKRFLKEGKSFVDSRDTVLFYEDRQISGKDSLFSFLKKYAKFQEFKLLESQRLKNWVKKEFKNFGAEIDDKALQQLFVFVGNDLWRMANEIKKLVSFKGGEVIKIKDVELLVKPKIESDIFKTIDAIASKNKKRALKLLKAHLEKGDSPLYLFSMINFQFRNLLIIKDLIRRNLSPYVATGLHPYVIKKSFALSKKFKISELKEIYQKIFQVDFKIKTGRITPETALDLLITEI